MSALVEHATRDPVASVGDGEQEEQKGYVQLLLRPSRFSQIFIEVILPFVVIRLILLLVGVLTIIYIEPLVNVHQPIHLDQQHMRLPDMLTLMWANFDSGFYIPLASGGYWGANTLHGASNWAFFPLYPLLIHIFAIPLATYPNTDLLAGIATSNASALIALIYLYKLTMREFNRSIAARTVLYLMLFPMSFYLSAVYPEALFMALVISCIYYARMQRWWLAGFLGGLVALTRPQGVLMVIVAGWEYWQYLGDRFAPLEAQEKNIITRFTNWLHSRILGLWRALRDWHTWLGFTALLQIPLGLSLFLLYAKWKVGTFFASQLTERNGWGRTLTNPIHVLKNALLHPIAPSPWEWNFYDLNILVIVLFSLALIPIFRRLPAIYGIFSLLFVLLPLSSGDINSIARYYMEVFPVFIWLAWWTSRGNDAQKEVRHNLIVSIFAILLSFGMVLWVLGVYAVA